MRSRALVAPALAVLLAGAAHAEGARIASPHPLAPELSPGDVYMGVRLLGALRLDPVTVDGIALVELSALAFDEDEDRLYAISDRGAVFHLVLTWDGDGLLADARALEAHALRDATGRPLAGREADAEGALALGARNARRGDTELVVSFERHPRVLRYGPRGDLLGSIDLPADLRGRGRYRSANRGLEALTWHPRHGFLTAPEQPFKDSAPDEIELRAIPTGPRWRYPLATEPNAALTALEVLPDGSILALERGHGYFYVPFVTTLRRIRELPADGALVSGIETVVRMTTAEGWKLDNFEGLTRERGNRILLVSDDNGRAYQQTLLVALELTDTDSSRAAAAAPRAPPRFAMRN